MYLARKTINRQTHYFIRATYADGRVLKSKNIFHLGTDPSSYIIYPGGNAYYYDDAIEEALRQKGVPYTADELDTLFWEFLDPEIQRVIKAFQRTIRTSKKSSTAHDPHLHDFDKRRLHFLKFASPDQRNLHSLPHKLFKDLFGKSRDEREQYFIFHERILHPREYKTYVYTIFNLQQLFPQNVSANTIPTMDGARMDECFLDLLCRLNEDHTFWAGMNTTDSLQDYLVKYVIMYFDYDFPGRSLFFDYLNEFRNRHRAYTPPKKVRVKMEEAVRLFETSWESLKNMDERSFNRLYRKLAMKHHPDQGGKEDVFVKIKEIYEGLMKKKK